MPQSKPKPTLIQRYTILKGKLEKELAEKKLDYQHARGIKGNMIEMPIGGYEKDLREQIRLHRASLRLLEDTYNGESDEIV